MASRFLLRAAGAARSARGHRGPVAGLICAPPTDPSLGVFSSAGSLAGRVSALQGLRHYGTPFNRYTNIAELNKALRKVEKRLGALEEKCDTEHRSPTIDELKEDFNRLANAIMFVGFGFTIGTVLYYNCKDSSPKWRSL